MTEGILANMVGLGSALVVVVAYVFIISLVIVCLIRVSRYFLTAGKEQKMIRMELSKLAEEVHLIRQELKDRKEQNSSTKSG